MDQINKIIVRMPNWVGDLVMATPVLADLRRAYPQASITAMAPSSICELLQTDTAIDELFCFSRSKNPFSHSLGQRDIIGKIRAGQYDLGVLLTHSFSSAWWFWQARVQRRVGYKGHFRDFLLTDRVAKPSEKLHQVDFYKYLLQALHLPHSQSQPRLFVDQEEREMAKKRLQQNGFVRGTPLVGMNPAAAYGSAKCWPKERFRSLAIRLAKQGIFVVFFGDANGADLVKEICQGLDQKVINLAGLTSLRELVCLIQECDVFVTNDSGPMHIAAALDVPLVSLFGSTDDAVTGPYNQADSVIRKKVGCSPCLKRECPIDFRCMNFITVEEVLARVKRCLEP